MDRFKDAADLCIAAYDDSIYFHSSRMRKKQIETSGDCWTLVKTLPPLSLWKKTTASDSTSADDTGGNFPGIAFALIVRGTHVHSDVIDDFDLADLMRNGEAANLMMTGLADVVRQFFLEHEILVNAPLLFCGHSLGASKSEYLFRALRCECAVSQCVTFDSPGLPEQCLRAVCPDQEAQTRISKQQITLNGMLML